MNPAAIEKHFKKLMEEGMQVDLSNPNLSGTPERVARMYQEFLKGEGSDFEGLTVFPNSENYDQIILLDNIHFVSSCSHHLLPFFGLAWLAYIPDKFLMGASKPARVIKHYGSRLQLQENLSQQVADYIQKELKPKALLLVMRATHTCMSCRGAEQYAGAGMVTSSIKGLFKSEKISKDEALDLIKISIMLNK
jgi:GTP cyclohydrolase I